MNKLIRGVAASIATAAALSAVVSPSAFATTHNNQCEYGESCVFLNSNYSGGMDDMASTDATWVGNTYSSGGAVHDSASSGFGNGRAEQYWVNINFSGAYFILGIDQYDPLWTTHQPNASSSTYNYNDKIDSNALYVP